jgi:hypothetical protein
MASNQFLFPPVVPSLASAPGSPVNGMAYYDTTLGVYRVYNNSAWYSLSPNFGLSFAYPTPIVQTITIIGYVNSPRTLTGVKNAKTASGSATTALTVNGSNVSGFPSSITTTNSNYTISQALAVGDVVKFVISAISSPTMLEFTLIGTNS